MSRIKRTPPIDTKGRYTLIAPYVADATKVYTCRAIRSFDDVYEQGEDVFPEYYENVGLDITVFNEDADTGANIITIMDDDGGVIYVPDTYIESYPMMGNVTYSHTVISVSLGAIPDYIDLEFTKTQILNVITDLVNPPTKVVNVNKAPSVGLVTPADHEVAEANRTASIVYRTTDYARVLQLEAKVQEQIEVIERMNQILIDSGAIPPP